MTTRDDDPDEACLPPHLIKHQCYAIWCCKRGWKFAKKSKALTIFKPTPEFDPRPHFLSAEEEYPMRPEVSNTKEVCSCPTSLYFWKEHYPKIKVSTKGAETCTDCLMYLNSLKFIPATVADGIKEDAFIRAGGKSLDGEVG